jgi:hypothetical protein
MDPNTIAGSQDLHSLIAKPWTFGWTRVLGHSHSVAFSYRVLTHLIVRLRLMMYLLFLFLVVLFLFVTHLHFILKAVRV